MRVLLAILALAAPLCSEGFDDRPKHAHPATYLGIDALHGPSDWDWWYLPSPPAAFTLYVQTGIGPLCGCPQGSPFTPFVEVYDPTGALLGAYQGTASDLSVALSGVSGPLYVRVSGVPWVPHVAAPYNMLTL